MQSIEIRPAYLLDYEAFGIIMDDRPGYALISFFYKGFRHIEWVPEDEYVEKGSYSIEYTSNL